jgi:hypothetical protein
LREVAAAQALDPIEFAALARHDDESPAAGMARSR